MKRTDRLLPSDFADHSVWEFADDLEGQLANETYMRRVAKLPVASLSSRVVGTKLRLANGQSVFGILGNIDLDDPLRTEHFIVVTVFRASGERFDLARYFDVDYPQRDAAALAAFLQLPVGSVFPIHYDITDVAIGHANCRRRSIPAVPISRLSDEELIGLALGRSAG